MAEKDDDDMRVQSYSLAEAPVDFSSWPLSEDVESKGLFNTPWTQAIKDLKKFLHTEDPYSVKADEDGIELADFLIKNADLSAEINKKKEDLIDKSGVKDVKVTYFKNWGYTRQGLFLYACPTEIGDVKDLVKACEELDIKVGCGGSYHSWAPLYPDPAHYDPHTKKNKFSLLINNRNLKLGLEWDIDRLFNRRIDYDPKKHRVQISPGVTTGELLKFFMEKNICIKADVIAQNFTYGGLLATGSHGTGRDQPIMADWISSMKVVGADGHVRNYPDDFDKITLPKGVTVDDAMNALRLHLGVFGVVVELSLDVVPMESSIVHHSYPQLGELFYGPNPRIKEVMKNNWSVQILWFPFNSLDIVGGLLQGMPFTDLWQPKTDEVWLRTVNPTDKYTETNNWGQLQKKLTDTIQNAFAGELGSPLISRYPFMTPAYLSQGFKVIKKTHPSDEPKLETLPYAIHFLYGLNFTPVNDMEFAFPVDFERADGFDHLIKAIEIVVDEVSKAAKPWHKSWTTKSFPLSSAMDIRLIKKSKCLMCPAAIHDYSHTAYIEVLSFHGNEHYKDFFKKVAKRWMEEKGVPHWAKQWSFLKDEGIYQHLRKYYGDNMKKFTTVIDAVNGDKKDLFLNKTMKELLFDD